MAVGWILLGNGVGVLQKMITFAGLPFAVKPVS